MNTLYTAPSFQLDGFHCPLCNTFSHQEFSSTVRQSQMGDYIHVEGLYVAYCSKCHEYSVWVNENMVYPKATGVALPNADLDDDIKTDYLEAASIVQESPRGAAALLRLALQKLCVQLGQRGRNINDDIAALVKKGLSPTIQQSLDFVRVVGNNAVHPGELDIRDNKIVAATLFDLINLIANAMISHPKEVDKLYKTLPKDSRRAIIGRDSRRTR